jgi:hypothetical protein
LIKEDYSFIKICRIITLEIIGFWLITEVFESKRSGGEIQPGRGYNFTGIETLTFPQAITSIVDQDNNDLTSYLSGQVLTPVFPIYGINVNGVSIYNFEESAGLIAYDASGNGNHASINLNGSSESSFHITTNNFQSRQNEIGYNNKGTDPFNLNAYVPINESNPTKDVLGNIL